MFTNGSQWMENVKISIFCSCNLPDHQSESPTGVSISHTASPCFHLMTSHWAIITKDYDISYLTSCFAHDGKNAFANTDDRWVNRNKLEHTDRRSIWIICVLFVYYSSLN